MDRSEARVIIKCPTPDSPSAHFYVLAGMTDHFREVVKDHGLRVPGIGNTPEGDRHITVLPEQGCLEPIDPAQLSQTVANIFGDTAIVEIAEGGNVVVTLTAEASNQFGL